MTNLSWLLACGQLFGGSSGNLFVFENLQEGQSLYHFLPFTNNGNFSLTLIINQESPENKQCVLTSVNKAFLNPRVFRMSIKHHRSHAAVEACIQH